MTAGSRRPPRLPRALAKMALPRGLLRECLLGDLDEEFSRRRTGAPRDAVRWYFREACSLAWYGVRCRFGFEQRSRLAGSQNLPVQPGRLHGPGAVFRSLSVLTDLRHASRGLRHNPGPVLISGLSLALGIAATTTMVSVIDAIDFRPLPYRDAERLVQLNPTSSDGDLTTPSAKLFHEWEQRTRSYERFAAASIIAVAVGTDGERILSGSRVTADFFPTLGVPPSLGRTFTPDEVRTGARVAVISYSAWRSEFSGDRSAVGRSVVLSWAGEFRSVDAEPYTIVGVLPAAVRYPRGNDIWLPASDPLGGYVTVVGRLRESVSMAAARGELDAVSRQLAVDRPGEYADRPSTVSSIRDAVRMRADERGSSARFLLLCIAGFVLVLAVINAAVVCIVRTVRQRQDLLIRAALGAPRLRLLTLMLAQGLIVSLAGGVLGIVVAHWGIELADSRLAVAASGLNPVLDWRVIGAGLSLSIAGGVVVGLFPAASVLRKDPPGGRAMHSGARSSPIGGRLQGGLVVAQVACAVVLINGAGVLTRDFLRVVSRDLGFEADRLVVAGLQMGDAPPSDATGVSDRIASLPGVVTVALGGKPTRSFSYRLESGESLSSVGRPRPYRVSADYFATLRIPILAGRAFLTTDRTGSQRVGVVNQTAAQRWWPAEMPVGKRLFVESGDAEGDVVTIVGMSADERVERDVRGPVEPVLYTPWEQLTDEGRRTELFVRTAGSAGALLPEVRATIQEMRHGQGWQGDYIVTMTDIVGSHVRLQRFRASALSVFSLFGLVLASMGVYGVVASVVNQRTPEIGIRVALGARRADVLALVARSGIALALLGIGIGIAGTLGAGRVLASIVVTDGAVDVSTILGPSAVLAIVVAVACYLPGRRAARIDPTRALREF